MRTSRRSLLVGLAGLASPFSVASPARSATPARALSILNLHTGERASATYWEAGGYVTDALAAFDKVLRDHRTGAVHPMDPRVLDIAAVLTRQLGCRDAVSIISGYRSPATNSRLRAASSGVATRSLHMDGKALDIRLPGVGLEQLRAAAWALQAGGVGFYPGSDFVHIDVGRVRRWQG